VKKRFVRMSACSPEGLAFSFNGGKDSTVLLHLLLAGIQRWRHEQGKTWQPEQGLSGIHVFYFLSDHDFAEVVHFVKECNECHSLRLQMYTCNFKEGLEQMLKDLPIKAIFLGTRHADPNCKNQVRSLLLGEASIMMLV
jgi:FAD synthetase